ncbi:MAG: DUF4435 domain-containing protein [Bacteroidaceae bacterium]|nr:DUF4435 domain-containing protein [Bacteroidaceae bacterium]
MSLSLRNNLSSQYLEAASKLSPRQKRRRIVAYVESYDDIFFWRSILSEFENETRYFRVMLPSNSSLSKGKKMVLTSCLRSTQLGKNLIACVDSDYDYLLQDSTDISREMNTNPYIFQTYTYAIENYQCYAENLHDICVESTLNDHQIFNFPAYMREYSEIVWPLFVWNILLYRHHMNNSFPMNVFCNITIPPTIDIRKPKFSLDALRLQVERKMDELATRLPQFVDKLEGMDEELQRLGVTPQYTYLFMKGHHIKENVVMKLVTPVCIQLRREREEQIRRLAQHRKQYENELSGYNNSASPVEVIMRKNDNYKDLFLYEWIREDIKQFLEECEKK